MTCRHCQPDAREGVSVAKMDKRCGTCVFYMPDPIKQESGACAFYGSLIYPFRYPSFDAGYTGCPNWTDNIEEAREWL